MSRVLFTCHGGNIVLPDHRLVLADRQTGGNLIVNPPRDVWERSELTAHELTHWSFLVAATGRAMLDMLPQLKGGCINYWEAGNWALNDDADPPGRKTARDYRSVHMHLLGRSPGATDPAWRWGEAPDFPPFAERHAWAAGNERLTAKECCDIVTRTGSLLHSQYELQSAQMSVWEVCSGCAYPLPLLNDSTATMCAECQ